MNVDQKPLAQLTEEAIQILYRELGTADAVRFLRQFSTGFGNYTDERRAQEDLQTLEEVIAEIKLRRSQYEAQE